MPTLNITYTFEIIGTLSQTKYFTVQSARVIPDGNLVVIKSLNAQYQKDLELKCQIKSRHMLMKSIEHEHIRKVYQILEEGNSLYIIQEYIEGKTLLEVFKSTYRSLDWIETIDIIHQFLSALSYTHTMNIFHNNLQPDCIYLAKDKRIVVDSFGKPESSYIKIESGQQLFHPIYYIAPEQLNGLAIGASADIYTSAVIIYQMLTNRLPWHLSDLNNPLASKYKTLNSPVLDPSFFNQLIPYWLFTVLRKALQIDIDKRYRTIAEFQLALFEQKEISTFIKPTPKQVIPKEEQLSPSPEKEPEISLPKQPPSSDLEPVTHDSSKISDITNVEPEPTSFEEYINKEPISKDYEPLNIYEPEITIFMPEPDTPNEDIDSDYQLDLLCEPEPEDLQEVKKPDHISSVTTAQTSEIIHDTQKEVPKKDHIVVEENGHKQVAIQSLPKSTPLPEPQPVTVSIPPKTKPISTTPQSPTPQNTTEPIIPKIQSPKPKPQTFTEDITPLKKTFKTFAIITIIILIITIGKYVWQWHKNSFKITNTDSLVSTTPLEEIKPKVKNLPIDMVKVKGGKVFIGSLDSEATENEFPVFEMTLGDFWMSKFEITQAQWMMVYSTNPSSIQDEKLPVDNVSFFDVVEFCNKKSEMDGYIPCYEFRDGNIICDFRANGYRLPTEAEWEFAAKEGLADYPYPYSGSLDPDSVAWFQDNSSLKSHPVGKKKPNALGLYDLCGNIAEWTWNWYAPYTQKSAQSFEGPEKGDEKVIRGGSWTDIVLQLRITARNHKAPWTKSPYIGFRVVRSL